MARQVKDIEHLRGVMGTLPHQNPDLETKFIRGVEGIKVELVDYNVNPYKGMYVLATSCWGSKINKWDETKPEHRFLVIKAALQKQALPLALEVPHFTFAIEGPSRAAFDQMARTRVGVVFSAKGMRDNNWKDCSIRIPTALWPTREDFECRDKQLNHEIMTEEEFKKAGKVERYTQIIANMIGVKRTYADIVDSGMGSWQAARTVLPLYVVYGYSASYHMAALMNVCANRMKFCEMEDTVAIAWLMQKAVEQKFPLLGSFLRPGCDSGKKCQYHQAYSMSEMFGCLFAACGRNPDQSDYTYAEFNETCTNYKDLEDQLGIKITRPNEWMDYTWENLPDSDKILFMEGSI